MATTYKYAVTDQTTPGGTAGTRGFAEEARRQVGVIQNIVDCALTNIGSAGIVQLLGAQAGYLALLVGIQVLTLEGTTLVVDAGDGTNDDAFIDAADCNTGTAPVRYASNLTYANGTGDLDITTGLQNQLFGVPGGKLYTAYDTLDMVFDEAAVASKMRMTALVINMDGSGMTHAMVQGASFL